MRLLMKLIVALSALGGSGAFADENYAEWPLLQNPFPSTGGGGVMIDGYAPVIKDGKCITNFTAIMPDAKRYENIVEFEITQVQGGVLCSGGKWRSLDGSASGTTPFRVFIKDGVVRRAP